MKLRSTLIAAALTVLPTGTMMVAPAFIGTTPAHAAKKTKKAKKTTVGALLSGLINVNVQDVNVTAKDLVDVKNVLNNNKIDVLRNAIQNNKIASENQNLLNNTLREAKILTDNQTVVGILSGVPVILNQ
ncbi:MAG: hypothetical protein KY468_21195 [Armatimonadetes bacterium]|nr:hypothetical protein [Armatimonadota bacterium]